MLTTEPRATVAGCSRRHKRPDCACSQGKIRCIEFQRSIFSPLPRNLMPLFNQSIRRKIVGIALGLIVLMLERGA